jgi:hypothetical protein
MAVIKVYKRLYEDGVVIVTDFFDDGKSDENPLPAYPSQLFTCAGTQASFITKSRVSRDTVFDGIVRSQETCGYKTHIEVLPDKNKTVNPPWPRQQLKHNEVRIGDMQLN